MKKLTFLLILISSFFIFSCGEYVPPYTSEEICDIFNDTFPYEFTIDHEDASEDSTYVWLSCSIFPNDLVYAYFSNQHTEFGYTQSFETNFFSLFYEEQITNDITSFISNYLKDYNYKLILDTKSNTNDVYHSLFTYDKFLSDYNCFYCTIVLDKEYSGDLQTWINNLHFDQSSCFTSGTSSLFLDIYCIDGIELSTITEQSIEEGILKNYTELYFY